MNECLLLRINDPLILIPPFFYTRHDTEEDELKIAVAVAHPTHRKNVNITR